MRLNWEAIAGTREQFGMELPPMPAYRAKVPGGWFVFIGNEKFGLGASLFYPDPEHVWDGNSIP